MSAAKPIGTKRPPRSLSGASGRREAFRARIYRKTFSEGLKLGLKDFVRIREDSKTLKIEEILKEDFCIRQIED